MMQIESDHKWQPSDQLDGEILKHGEVIQVIWPDGCGEAVTVKIIETLRQSSSMGHSYDYSTYNANYELDYHGMTLNVPLRGLAARRVVVK